MCVVDIGYQIFCAATALHLDCGKVTGSVIKNAG